MMLFGWFGRHLAHERNRNTFAWLAIGATFPPLLLILYIMPPVAADAREDA